MKIDREVLLLLLLLFFFTRNVVLFHGRSTSTDVFLDHNGLTSAPHDKLITLFFFFFVLLINRR